MEKKSKQLYDIHHYYNPTQHADFNQQNILKNNAHCKQKPKRQKQSWVIDKKYNIFPSLRDYKKYDAFPPFSFSFFTYSIRNCIKYIFVFLIMIVSVFALLLLGGLLTFLICSPLVAIFILWLGASILEKLLKMLNL